MHTVRMLAIAAVIAVTSAFVAPNASSAASGVGTGEGSASLLRVVLGGDSVLAGVELSADDGRANSDPAAGAIVAATRLAPVRVFSDSVPALNESASATEVRSTQGTDEDTTAVDVIDNPVLGGTVAPATLRAIVDEQGPRSTLAAALQDLSVAGGLLSLPDAVTGLGNHAPLSHSTSTRSAEVDALELLDLGALLEGLGLPLGDLSVATLGDLLAATGVSVPTAGTAFTGPIADASGLQGLADAGLAVNDLQSDLGGAVDDLAAFDLEAGLLGALIDAIEIVSGETINDHCDLLTESVLAALAASIDPLAPDLLAAADALAEVLADVNDALAGTGASVDCTTLAELVDTVAGLIGDILDLLRGSVTTLDAVSLLSLADVSAGLEALATDDPATSVAEVTASIGQIDVASTVFDVLDALTASAVDDLAASVSDAVNDILATIDGVLGSLIDIDLLDRSGTGISQTGDKVTAVANLVLARVTLSPPAALTDLIAGLVPAASMSTAIVDLGGTLPAVGTEMQTLENNLGNDVEALSQGAEIEVLNLTNRATFGPAAGSTTDTPGAPAGGTPSGEQTSSPPLPKTGLEQGALMLGAIALLGGSWLGLRLSGLSGLSRRRHSP